jgi:hypothetical protein
MVEIEIGILRGRCLVRRVADRRLGTTAQCLRSPNRMYAHNRKGSSSPQERWGKSIALSLKGPRLNELYACW